MQNVALAAGGCRLKALRLRWSARTALRGNYATDSIHWLAGTIAAQLLSNDH